MAKNASLCWQCQMRMIQYKTSITGKPLKYGLCRDCFERKAARNPGNGGRFCNGRRDDMKESVSETKHGIDHI